MDCLTDEERAELNSVATSRIVSQDNAQSWPPRARELSDLQRALVSRAVNTEINLLRRLYGVSSGTVFSFGAATFEEQVRALSEVEDWLYPSEEVDYGLSLSEAALAPSAIEDAWRSMPTSAESEEAALRDAARRERDYDDGVIRDDDH